MSHLAIVRAPGKESREVWVRQDAILGRRPGDLSYAVCARTEKEVLELGVQDVLVSRRHARLFWEEQALWLQDLGSENGTFLDGNPLPHAGKGKPGKPVAAPQGTVNLGLGPCCLLELEQIASPLGISPGDWRHISGHLSYRDMLRLIELCRWSEDFKETLAQPISPAGVRECFAKVKGLLETFPELYQELEQKVRYVEAVLLPDDNLEVEERRPLQIFCRNLISRLGSHYLKR